MTKQARNKLLAKLKAEASEQITAEEAVEQAIEPALEGDTDRVNAIFKNAKSIASYLHEEFSIPYPSGYADRERTLKYMSTCFVNKLTA